jgi:hypothetical protein
MTHLVMVSGGPDSAWCLRYVLLTTDAPAIALRVEILDAGGRAPFETRAFARICDLLERIRPIERITCGLTVPLSCVAADWVLLGGIMGGVIAGRPEIIDVWDHAVLVNGASPHKDLGSDLETKGHKVIFCDYQPTCENMLYDIAEKIKKRLTGDVSLAYLKLHETENSYGEWFAEDQVGFR